MHHTKPIRDQRSWSPAAAYFRGRKIHARLQSVALGFTLVEMLIVIGMVAVLSAISVPAVFRLAESNRNISCQTNMHAIYQALKMYRLDEEGYPPYDPSASTEADKGLGLWALHVYGLRTPFGIDLNSPTARYIRGVKSLHCPDHRSETRYTNPDNSAYFNLDYLSYQFTIPTSGDWAQYADAGQTTYQTYRGVSDENAENYRRQLYPPPGDLRKHLRDWYPADDTVVTWCPHHRQFTRAGTDQDNVLFLDGSIERLPVEQNCGGKTLTGWQRKPKRECQ